MGLGDRSLPLVYSCSGCSSAAQMANYVALCLDRGRQAEMSCIAGVGGDVPSLVRTARSGRPVVAIDGCPLHCVRHCLARHDVTPAIHLTLTEMGVKKRFHTQFSKDEAAAAYQRAVAILKGLRTADSAAEGRKRE